MKRSTHSPSRFQTATGKPCSSTLSARFSPITPSPIIPKDACAIRTLLRLHDCVFHDIGERFQPRVDILAEIHADRAPVARLQRLEVADRLRAAEHTERELLARQRHI